MLLRDKIEPVIEELLDGRILLEEAMTEFEKLYIQNALARNSDHLSRTAEAIGIHRNTLAKRVASYKALPPKKKRSSGRGRT